MKKTPLSELVFYLHVPILLTWVGLFFVPSSMWSARPIFHFYYVLSIVAINYLWGVCIWKKTGKYQSVCPLTTLTQCLRGYKIEQEGNHNHSFVVEFIDLFRLKIRPKTVGNLMLATIPLTIYFAFF